MNAQPVHILAAFLGASLQEIVHWYERREKLSARRYQKDMRSPLYWLITLAMIGASALGAVLWFDSESRPPDPKTYVVVAAAFPMFVKRGIQGIARKTDTHLGGEVTKNSIIKDYFGLS